MDSPSFRLVVRWLGLLDDDRANLVAVRVEKRVLVRVARLRVGAKVGALIPRGEQAEKRIDTGSVVATPENMNEPRIKELLEPDFKKWLKED